MRMVRSPDTWALAPALNSRVSQGLGCESHLRLNTQTRLSEERKIQAETPPPSPPPKSQLCEASNLLTELIVIISHIHISNHTAHLQLTVLRVNYIYLTLGKTGITHDMYV